jgi:hypothetical protein
MLWYRSVHVRGVKTLAHRAAYTKRYGPIPEGMFVLHGCDTKACANPDHLYLGDHKQNMADAAAHGRMARAEQSGPAKLTWEVVRRIRAEAGNGESQRAIGARVGLSQSNISAILSGKSWREDA